MSSKDKTKFKSLKTAPVQVFEYIKRCFAAIAVHFKFDKSLSVHFNNGASCYTDSKGIYIGKNFPLFKGLASTNLISGVLGVIYHEIGHIIYTPFADNYRADKMLHKGLFWPTFAPAGDETIIEEIRDFILADEKNASKVCTIYHHLDNIVEDGRIERLLIDLERFDLFLRGLKRIRLIQWDNITEYKEVKDAFNDPKTAFPTMANVILQYAKYGEIKGLNKDDLDDEPILDFYSFIDDIDYFLANSTAFTLRASLNRLFVKLWPKYIFPYLKSIEEEENEESEDGSSGEESSSESGEGSGGGEGIYSPSLAAALAKATGTEEPTTLSEEEVKKLEEMAKSVRPESSGSENGSEQPSSSMSPKRITIVETNEIEDGSGYSVHKTKDELREAEPIDLESVLSTTLPDEERSDEEKDILSEAVKDISTIDVGDKHRHLSWRIVDATVPINAKELYEELKTFVNKAKIYARKVKRDLEFEPKQFKQSGHFGGTKFNASAVAKNNLKYFSKNIYKPGKPTLSVAILIDESGSMSGQKIRMARIAAIQLFEFCTELNVPLAVFGHTADEGGYKVIINSYSYFNDNSPDAKYKLLNIRSRSNNRDGAALRYVAEHLLKQPTEKKLLFVVSDGQPAASGYNGSEAFKDVAQAVHHYEKKGIRTIAAAIDQDRDSIKAMYGSNNFLNITNLDKLPENLVRVIKGQIW